MGARAYLFEKLSTAVVLTIVGIFALKYPKIATAISSAFNIKDKAQSTFMNQDPTKSCESTMMGTVNSQDAAHVHYHYTITVEGAV